MKLTKILSVIAIVGLLVVGTAFAATDFGNNIVNRWNSSDLDGRSNYRNSHMMNYFEDEDLYEENKKDMMSNLEVRLNYQVENSLITQEEANELLEEYKQRLEEGQHFYFGNMRGRRSRGYSDEGLNYGYNRMMDLTGLDEEEFEQYRLENCPAGVSMIDHLKEEGLYEDWEKDMMNRLEDRLEYQVENGLITQEEANELLEEYEQRLEEGPPFYFGGMRRSPRSFRDSNTFSRGFGCR